MDPKPSGARSRQEDDPLSAARDAAEAFGSGDLDKAERLLEAGITRAADRAVELDASSAAGNESPGTSAGRRQEAWSQSGGLPALLALRAQAALERGCFRHAVVLCTAALRLAPSFAPGFNSRGVALACLGEPAAALRDFDAALDSSPAGEAPMPLANRGRVRLMMGDVDGSRRDISDALSQAEEAQERRKKLRRTARRASTKSTAAVRFAAGARGKGRGAAGGGKGEGEGEGEGKGTAATSGKDGAEEVGKGEGGDAHALEQQRSGGGAAGGPSPLRYPGPERQVLQEQETMGLALSTTGGMAHFAVVAALGEDASKAKEAFTQAGKAQPSMPLWLAWVKAQVDIHGGADAARALERPITRARRLLGQSDGRSIRKAPPRGAATGAILAAALCTRASASLARGSVHGAAADAREATAVAPHESPLRAKAWALQGAALEACAMLWARGDRGALRQSRRALEAGAEAFLAAHAQHCRAVAAAERAVAEARGAEKRPAQEEGNDGGPEESGRAEAKKAAKRARRKAETALRKVEAKAPMFHLLPEAEAGEEAASGGAAGSGGEKDDQASPLCVRALPERMALCDDDMPSSGDSGAWEREAGAAAADVAHAHALCAAALSCFETVSSTSRLPAVGALLGEARVLQQLGRLDEAVSRWRTVARAAMAHVAPPAAEAGRPPRPAGNVGDSPLAGMVPTAVLALPSAGGPGFRDRLHAGLREALAAQAPAAAGSSATCPPASGGRADRQRRAFYDEAFNAASAQAHGLGAQLTQWRAPLAVLSTEIEEALDHGGGAGREGAEPVASERLVEALQDRARLYGAFGAVLLALEDAERARFLLSRVGREEGRGGRSLRAELYQALHRSDGPATLAEAVGGVA